MNILGGLIWAISIGILGYLFGHAFEWVIGDVERYELQLFIILAAIGSAVSYVHWLRKQKLAKQPATPEK